MNSEEESFGPRVDDDCIPMIELCLRCGERSMRLNLKEVIEIWIGVICGLACRVRLGTMLGATTTTTTTT